jgi:hypothetical protein
LLNNLEFLTEEQQHGPLRRTIMIFVYILAGVAVLIILLLIIAALQPAEYRVNNQWFDGEEVKTWGFPTLA